MKKSALKGQGKETAAVNEFEKCRKAENGVNIYYYKNPSLHGFYISLFVRAGSMYEDEKYAGITHFLEHAAIRNVNKLYRMKLYALLDKYGIEFNASTYSEMMQFYLSGSSANFSVGAEIITRILSPLTLDKSEIDAERKRIKAEIRESDERTSLAGFTAKKVYGGTTLCASVAGTNEGIDRISGKKLEEYRRKVMSIENIFFYVTGNFSDEDICCLSSLVEKSDLYGGTARDNVAPVPEGFLKRPDEIFIKNADFTMLRFTFDIDMTRYSVAETDILYDMLLSGYNSRLFIELSEKRGLFYDVSGATERYKNVGTLHFSFEVKERDIKEAISVTVDILNSLKNGKLSEDECMKAGYVDNAYMLYDDFRELNFTFAYDNHIMAENYRSVDERKRRYEKVSAERITQMAREIFVRDNLTVTMKAKKKNINCDELREILKRLI